MAFETIPRSNLHTHTTYGDGKNTPEEIILQAIENGMETLGFSEHSTFPFDKVEYSLRAEKIEAYREEIENLKKVYGDRIHIMLGLEQDAYSHIPPVGYEYLIGSLHYVKKDGEYLAVDASPQHFAKILETYYGGNAYAFACDYFEQVATLPQRVNCDIFGHFDLISKFNQGNVFFDEDDRRYLAPAIDTLDELIRADKIIEINTGAAPRGYRTIPYPASPFLSRIAEKGGRVTFSSDSHAKETLLFGFEDALNHAKASGIRAITVMTRHGWKEFGL